MKPEWNPEMPEGEPVGVVTSTVDAEEITGEVDVWSLHPLPEGWRVH